MKKVSLMSCLFSKRQKNSPKYCLHINFRDKINYFEAIPLYDIPWTSLIVLDQGVAVANLGKVKVTSISSGWGRSEIDVASLIKWIENWLREVKNECGHLVMRL